jgi:hypothetical protein
MGRGRAQERKPSGRRGSSFRATLSGDTAGTWSLRRQAEAKGMQAELEETDGGWAREDVMITGEYGICVVRMPAVKNWAKFGGKRLRHVVAELKVEITGRVKVTMAHARLPQGFESTVGAGAPGQIYCERFDGCVMTVHSGVRNRDVRRFKDLLGGDGNVNRREIKYAKYNCRGPRQLSNLFSPNIIRAHAYAANLNHKNGTCAVVFCFQLEPGANVTFGSMECDFYCYPRASFR